MNYRLRLNIKAISLAEKMLGKSYSEFNHESEEENIVLLYAMVLANNDDVFTLDNFKKLIANEKIYADMMKEAERALLFVGQFSKEQAVSGNEQAVSGNEQAVSGKPYISDLANAFIMNGVNAHYVMYEMDLYEMEGLAKQIDFMKKERLEEGRLWAFYNVLPHTDKIKKPSDLIMFDWEKENEKKIAEMDIERDLERFARFMGDNLNFTN